MKVVINRCYGGFSITNAVFDHMGLPRERFGYPDNRTFGIAGSGDEYRAHPKLVAAVEALGSKRASGDCCELAIVEIPDDVEWGIGGYDGLEWVEEKHRTWT